MIQYLWLLFLLLLACGDGEPTRPDPAPAGGVLWKVRVGPRVAAESAGKPLSLRAWGPWWSPLWTRSFRVDKAGGIAQVRAPRPDRRLVSLTVERQGRILSGALYKDTLESQWLDLEVSEVTLDPTRLPGHGKRGGLLRCAPAGSPEGLPGGGVAAVRGSRCVCRPLVSRDLSLRSVWLLPWIGEEGLYAPVRIDSFISRDDWSGPADHWDLDGDDPVLLPLAGRPQVKAYSAGWSQKPLGRLTRRPSRRDRMPRGIGVWSPGWEPGSHPGGELVVGHADWKRFMFLVELSDGSHEVVPTWRTEKAGDLGYEDPPSLLWAMRWHKNRLADVQVEPLEGRLESLVLTGLQWSFITIHGSGGADKGFQCEGSPLHLECPPGKRALVVLETPLFENSKSGGLVFWPAGATPNLVLSTKARHRFEHRGRVTVEPGPLGPRIR